MRRNGIMPLPEWLTAKNFPIATGKPSAARTLRLAADVNVLVVGRCPDSWSGSFLR